VIGEYRPASFDRDIEKDVGGARQDEIRGQSKRPKHERLDKAAAAVGRGCDHVIQCSFGTASRVSARRS